MAFAQGSRSDLTYVVESTFGTTPATPNMTKIPYNTHSLDLSKEVLESAEIRSDRLTDVNRHGARQIGGDIEVEFRATDYDDLIESALFSTFSANVIKVGTTLKHLSIEDRALDIDQYRLFKGCTVNTFGMNVQANNMVTATFGIIGKDATISGTSVDATPTEASGNDPYDGNNFVSSITEGGSAISIVTGLEFTLENNIDPTFVIGSTSTPQLEYGRANITGTLTAYFEDASLINKFLDETESELQFVLDDSVTGNQYTFYFPRIKYNGAPVPVNDEQSRVLSLPFVALRDSVEETNIKITKA